MQNIDKRVVFIVVIILGVVFASAASGERPYSHILMETRFTTTISNNNPQAGETIAIDTQIEYFDGNAYQPMFPSFGKMRHLLLEKVYSEGSLLAATSQRIGIGSETGSVNVVINSQLIGSGIYLVKVPFDSVISSFSADNDVEISVYCQGQFLRGFQLLAEEFNDMVSSYGAILLGIATHAEWGTDPLTSGLDLSGFTLELKFNSFPLDANIDMPAVENGADVMVGNTVFQDTALSMYSGNYLGETSTGTNGEHSISFEARSGAQYYYAVFSDGGMLYQRSFLFERLLGYDSLDVVMPNSSAGYAREAILQAQVLFSGSPVQGASVDFRSQLVDNGIDDYLGTSLTNASGWASFVISQVISVGSYNIAVQASHNTIHAYAEGYLSVFREHATFEDILAGGQYRSYNDSHSQITISGYVLQDGKPVPYEPIQILGDGVLLETSTSNEGRFSASYPSSLPPGNYPQMLEISYIGGSWEIEPVMVDIVIEPAQPILDMKDTSMIYGDDQFQLLGTLVDRYGNPLDASGELSRYDPKRDSWVFEASYQIYGGILASSHPVILDAGQYTYRFETAETSDFHSTSATFNVLVESKGAGIQLLGTSPQVYYNQEANLQVELRDESGNPVEGETIVFSYFDIHSTLQEIARVSSDAFGIASYGWLASDHLELHTNPYSVMAVLDSSNYQATTLSFECSWIPSPIIMQLDPGENIYNQETMISAELYDITGNPLQDNTSIQLEVDGLVYDLQVKDGKIHQEHRYQSVGTQEIHVRHTNAILGVDSYYESCDLAFQLDINKTSAEIILLENNYYTNSTTEITILVKNAAGTALAGQEVILSLANIQTSGTTDGQGYAHILVDVTLSAGEYSLQVNIPETTQVKEASKTFIIMVWLLPIIEYEHTEIVYTDGGFLTVSIHDKMTNNPISNASVVLSYKSFGDYHFLGTGKSNETGMISIPIVNLDVGVYQIKIQFAESDTYSSIEIFGEIEVVPETVRFEVDLRDLGISHGKQLNISLVDEATRITSGTVNWYIKQESNIHTFGSMELDRTGILALEIPGDLVGEYLLELYYVDPMGRFVVADKLIIEDIGYDPVPVADITFSMNRTIEYGSKSLGIELKIGQISLDGIDLELVIEFDTHNYSARAVTEDGLAWFDLPKEMNIGLFSYIVVSDGIILDGIIASGMLEFTPGNEAFAVEMPDQVRISDELEMHILDTFNENAVYELSISRDGEIMYSLRSNETTIILPLQDILNNTGTYELVLTRNHPLLEPFTIRSELEIGGIEVELRISSYNQESRLDMSIEAFVQDETIADMRYNITVYSASGSYSFISGSNLTLDLNGLGDLEIKIEALGIYIGVDFLKIDSKTTQIENPSSHDDGSDEGDTTELLASSLEILLVGGLVLASSVKSIGKKMKKVRKKRNSET